MEEVLSMKDGELPELSLIDEEFDGAFGSHYDFIDVSCLPPASGATVQL